MSWPVSNQMPSSFEVAIARFDEVNAQDPNLDQGQPREWLYARRLTDWVKRLKPDASEILLLAARCQHIRRWEIPRENYPATRAGYLKWRADLKVFHSRIAGEILQQSGFDHDTIRQVQELNLKKNFPSDPNASVLEDALCLVFLQFQFAALSARSDDDKMINALRKTWLKMSPAGRSRALELPYGPREQGLLARALEPAQSPGRASAP